MLPRLTGWRFVGPRYAGDTIRHGDTRMDFTTVTNNPRHPLMPSNAAIPFRNGGGKGVLLHLAMQPLAPLTDWKNGKNKVEHFFWNKEQKLIKYTFHTALEFELDRNRRLLTGISVTPSQVVRERKKEGTSSVELDYMLFLSEYTVDDMEVGIDKLPLWNEEAERATDLEVWKGIIKQKYPTRIMNFNRGEEQRYIELLNEYGIQQNTIKSMLKINADENDMSEYFKGATDNQGLFNKLIIPSINSTIEASVQTTEKLDLAESFLGVLKIAQELPRILKISEGARVLKTVLDPLIESIVEMIRVEKLTETHAEKGYAIREVLNEEDKRLELHIREVEKRNAEIEHDKKMTDWKLKNVEYMSILQNHQEVVRDIKTQDTQIQQWSSDIAQMEKDIHVLNVGVLSKEHYQLSGQAAETEKVIHNLQSSLDMDDLAAKLDDVQAKFEKNWELTTLPSWQYTVNQSHFLLKCQQTDIDDADNRKQNALINKNTLEQAKKATEAALQKHDDKQNELAQVFGEKIRSFPSDVLLQKKLELEYAKKEQAVLDINKKEHEGITSFLSETIGALSKDAEHLMQLIEHLDDEYAICLEQEEELVSAISVAFREDVIEVTPTREWFEYQKHTLDVKLKSQKLKRDDKARLLWKSDLDLELMNESKNINGRIPNYQLLRIRDKILEQGIRCLLGSDFLGALPHHERENELNRNPILPFSILLMEEDFDNVDFSFFSNEWMELPVFIIPRQRMGKQSAYPIQTVGLKQYTDSAFVPQDEGYQMWLDDDLWKKWINNVEEDHKNLTWDIELLQNYIREKELLSKRIEFFLLGKTSIEQLVEIDKLKDTHKEALETVDNKKAEKVLLLQEAKIIEIQMHEYVKSIRLLEDEQHRLEEWLKECQTYVRNKVYLGELDDEFKKTEIELNRAQQEWIEVKRIRDDFNEKFIKWTSSVSFQMPTLQNLNKSVRLPSFDEQYVGNSSFFLDLTETLGVEAKGLIEMYQSLVQERNNMSTQIASQQAELERLTERKLELENEMLQLDDNWRSFSVPVKAVAQLKKEKDILSSDRVGLISKRSNLEGKKEEKNNSRTSLESKLRQKEKEFKSAGYSIEIWEDFHFESFQRILNEQKVKLERLALETVKEKTDMVEKKKAISISLNGLREEDVKTSLYQLEHAQRMEIERNPSDSVKTWTDERYRIAKLLKERQNKKSTEFTALIQLIEKNETIAEFVKQEFLDEIIRLRLSSENNSEVVETLNYIKEWALAEAEDQLIQQQKAEDAIVFWSERVSRRVVLVINVMKSMVGKMKVKNSHGQFVELVRFKNNTRFPDNRSEIESAVKSHCISSIHDLMTEYGDADKVPKSQIARCTNISEIVLKALGELPRILFYIPDASGNFLKEKVKQHLYKEWNVINNGGEKESSKSGGQTLMAQIIMLIMLLKIEKHDNSPGLLITDNMFGEMSAPELIEPVFVALELLGVQWITVCPPNIKLDITSRFDTVYSLDITAENGKNVVTQKVQKYQRRYLEPSSAIEVAKREDESDESDEMTS
ncbi:hypothetical protein SAMN04487970_10606 [Paenibacillus tianmuensis]|uniref:Chromosome segregation ATPase n=1 Tax=Paenibacillus tianmuensis TaxID=624147 RepID=A0A1G4TP12_9BACL|nr:hypothetical protein [Paenibacillus tianmuensis]SCW83116.1 hypothetical protein SAMN04487970_10606 [Paenibacillus tianmuensis]